MNSKYNKKNQIFKNFAYFKENCSRLKTLVFNKCPYFDDWALTKVARMFSETLQSLEIGNCKNITDNGVVTLSHLR